jgi:hypothetical protein
VIEHQLADQKGNVIPAGDDRAEYLNERHAMMRRWPTIAVGVAPMQLWKTDDVY